MMREFHRSKPSSCEVTPSAVVKLKYWVIWPTLLTILQHLAKNWVLSTFMATTEAFKKLVSFDKHNIYSGLFPSRWLSVHGFPGQKVCIHIVFATYEFNSVVISS